MKLECPACGQRVIATGRTIVCPNCGTTSEVSIPTPLPSRNAPQPLPVIPIDEDMGRPARYEPPEPESDERKSLPPWLRATIILAGGFIGLVVILYIAAMVTSSRSAAPPVAVIAPPPPPAPPSAAPSKQGSELFSFKDVPPENQPAPTLVAPSVAVPEPPKLPIPAPPSAPARHIFPVTQAAVPKEEIVTDEAINAAIVKGVNYLITEFEKGSLHNAQGDQAAGTQCLCTLALLHAGEAINDERLNIHNPFMIGLIESMKKLDIPPNLATYTRSLRAQALAFHNRTEDRSALAADTRWLIAASVRGAYTYGDPPKGTTQPSQFGWDNSNSQYGALGVWAAAEAGIAVPASYWQGVQEHWEKSQSSKSGGWDYREGGEGTLSMTAAGVNMLFVANEMLSALRPDTQISRPPFSPSLQLGLDWLGSKDNAITLTGGWPFYTLYGMERAGLACGFKLFGKHDWFRELASQMLRMQQQNGAWAATSINIDTAFGLLFLSRGQHPLLMNKLNFIGAWANRPRDVAHLAKFTSKETERPLNWQVVSLNSDWADWTDSPILYLASHEAPILDEADYDKLRAFCQAGGLIFTQADGDSTEFNQFAELLAQKLFPAYPMADLPENHFIYNALFRPKEKFPLRAVSNGTRLLMVHSPTDIAKRWQARTPATDRPVFELGANLFVYATGMQVPRNRIDAFYVADLPGSANVTIPIARLKYAGNWDPEPWAWERESRLFRRATSLGLKPFTIDIENLKPDSAPFAHLTGTAAVSLSDAQITALRAYVEAGGVLLIDSCGGSAAFVKSIREGLLAKGFAGKETVPIATDHPLLAGKGDGLTQIAKPQVRPYVFTALAQAFPKLQILESGKGAVLLSELDLTSGLLGTNTLGIIGFDPAYAHAFVRNALLWTLNGRVAPPVVWKEPSPLPTQPAQ